MTVAGIMSGTSADGIDVTVVRITAAHPSDKNPPRRIARMGHPGLRVGHPILKLIAHEAFPYPKALRLAVLDAMNADSISTAELARLNWRLGIAYAEAVEETLRRHTIRLDLVGCHGQTLYHQARTEAYAGRRFACTWQLGEAQAITQRIGVPVVSNFRPADMFAGGQGAPLVSLLDHVFFASDKRGRVLQNIGGIANLTAIPAGAGPENLLAFDTGPGNMVIDWLAQELFDQRFDRNGAIAARGTVLAPVLRDALRHRYFKLKPPRTAGREQFGHAYAAAFLDKCRKLSKRGEDALATATALAAESIARSYEQFAKPLMDGKPVDYIVSGGGARNRTLMQMLSARLEPMGCTMRAPEEFGLPAEAKEAAAFALLAWQTWHRLPGNVPAATGAARAVILGQVTYI
jgi:anhydro-N-acetylmuramic acid kinase